MTELKQKAITQIRKLYSVDDDKSDDFISEYFDTEIELYIAGYTDAQNTITQCNRMALSNGIQWHDLRKDPNDLPKESCSVLVAYEYDDKTYTDNYINDKEKNIIGWESEYKEPYCSPRVIAWV